MMKHHQLINQVHHGIFLNGPQRLETVHPDEVGKTGTRSLKRHEDGGGEDNSGDDMDVSFDCEFNLSSKF